DVFPETAMAMFAERGRFTPGTNFAAWACTIARHRALAHLKKAGRDRMVFSAELVDAIARERATMGDELATRREGLEACLGRPGHGQRELVDQRYGREETIRQLAERTGRPVKTLYKTLERVRASLMSCIERRLAEGEA